MRTLPLAASMVSLALAIAESACDPPKAKPPEPATPTVAPSAPPVPAPSAAPAASDASAGRSIKETVGAVATIELTGRGKATITMTKPADVDALLAAIGTEQVPVKAPLRRCPDQWVLALKDKEGAVRGSVGLCTAETLAPEFSAPGVDRMPITLVDEASARKLLQIEAPSGGTSKPAATSSPKK